MELSVEMVAIVWPFVNENIMSTNWNFKEAAIMIFGCMLNGPSIDTLRSIIQEGCGILLNILMTDPNVSVRDSAAWVLCEICGRYLNEVPASMQTTLIESLIAALDMEPRVASHCAFALSFIFDSVAGDPTNTFLQPYFLTLLQKILAVCERTGSANAQVRENASFALMSLISCHIPETDPMLIEFYNFVLQKCEATFVCLFTHSFILSLILSLTHSLIHLLFEDNQIDRPNQPRYHLQLPDLLLCDVDLTGRAIKGYL